MNAFSAKTSIDCWIFVSALGDSFLYTFLCFLAYLWALGYIIELLQYKKHLQDSFSDIVHLVIMKMGLQGYEQYKIWSNLWLHENILFYLKKVEIKWLVVI